MGLAPAQLIPEIPLGDPVECQFNPSEYTVEKSVQFAELGVPGLSVPVLQYVRGLGRRLTVQLFFDTYEEGTDVRDHTNKVFGLLDVASATHVPAICRLRWDPGTWDARGDNSFRCVLERVTGRFTLFLTDGTPVRATLDVVLREYVDVDVAVRRDNLQSADHDKTVRLRHGETLHSVAAREYGDPALWRPIARANAIDNPRLVPSGTLLHVPALREGSPDGGVTS
jgi:hypothetical protein